MNEMHKELIITELEKRLSFIMDVTGSYVYEWYISTDTIQWFGNIDKCLGYHPDEFPRTVAARYDIIHPEDRARVVNTIKRYLASGEKDFYEEYRVIRKNEGVLYWSDSAKILFDESKQPYKWIGVNKDITIQKKSMEAMQRSYKTTRDILKNAPFGVFVINETGLVDYVNPVMLTISGETLENFKSFNILQDKKYSQSGLLEKIRAGFKGEYFCLNSIEIPFFTEQRKTSKNFVGIPIIEEDSRKLIIIVEEVTHP